MIVSSRTLALLACFAFASSSFAEVPFGPGDWPQWRGPLRNNLSSETGYARQWPDAGPPVVWQVDSVGVGYSSLAVKDGLIVTQGDLDGVEHIVCLKASDGSTVWAVQPEPVAVELTAKLVAEKKKLDKNTDGTIDEAEALIGIGPDFYGFEQAAVKGDEKAIAAARTAKLLKLLDTDGDGKLGFAETANRFRNQFTKIDKADKTADAAALAAQRTADIMKADKDADGKLSKKEANGTAAQDPFGRADVKDPASGKADDQLTPEELEAHFKKNEAGLDGLLSGEELATFYEQSQAGKDGTLSENELRGFFGGYRNSFGDGPRGTPTIDGKVVYAEGGNGDLTCLDLATGKTLWYKNLAKDFGGGKPGWGYSESPLVEGELLIVTPGGAKGTIAALDKHTGAEVWRSSAVEGAHYSSPQVAEIAGVRQIVQFASKNVFGVQLSDGKLLWTYSHANNGTANAATPIVRGDYVYASSGYGTGGGLVKVSNKDGVFSAEEVYFDKTLANHHGGVLLVGEYLYGFGTGLICQDFLSGKIAWKARSVTKGSLTYADGLLFLLGENHEVALADALPDSYQEKGRFKIDNFGRPSWAHPIVAGGRMYIRNMHRMTAYDVRAK
ncbi:MAG: PQQ-binding-like beta-propeller repeat protein [Planctomycetia bacterium]|nr:PQQ-binding-like beta-propeller repeat protein [Planctomycetia bacterium]